MIKLMFLLPLIMCFLWWLYLKENNWTIKQGLKGFAYIIAFNLVIAGFFVVMLYLTH